MATFATLVPVPIEAEPPPAALPPQPEVKIDDAPPVVPSTSASTSSSVDSTIAAVISASLEFGKENSSLDLMKEKKVKVKKPSTSPRGKDGAKSSPNNKVFKSATSSSKNKSVRNAKKLGSGEKRGRKTKEWYAASGKEPGFSKLKRSKKVWDDWDEPTFVSTKGDNKAKAGSKTTVGGGGTEKNSTSVANVTVSKFGKFGNFRAIFSFLDSNIK